MSEDGTTANAPAADEPKEPVGDRELVICTMDVPVEFEDPYLAVKKGDQLVVMEKHQNDWLLRRIDASGAYLTGKAGLVSPEHLRLLNVNEDPRETESFMAKWAGKRPKVKVSNLKLSLKALKEGKKDEKPSVEAPPTEALGDSAAQTLKLAVKKRLMHLEMREKRVEQGELRLVAIAKQLQEKKESLERQAQQIAERELKLLQGEKPTAVSRVRNPSRISHRRLQGLESLLSDGYSQAFLDRMARLVRAVITRKRFHKMITKMKELDTSSIIRNRNQALKEIYSSEAKYVSMLEQCVQLYLAKLLGVANFSNKPWISRRDIYDIFGTLDIIYELNKGIQKELSRRLDEWPSVQKFGDLFMRMAPILRLYSSYIRNFERGQLTLDKLRNNSPQFVSFCKDVAQNQAGGLTLESFLILPVQRLPRYQLLLKELLRYTSPTHIDFADLNEAHQTIVSICHDINAQKVMDANSARIRQMIEIDQVDSLSDYITGASYYIHQGVLSGLTQEEEEKFYYFLFSDTLLKTQAKMLNKKKFHVVECIELYDSLSIVDIPDGKVTQNAFELVSTYTGDEVEVEEGGTAEEVPPIRIDMCAVDGLQKEKWIIAVNGYNGLFNSEESLRQWKSIRNAGPAAKREKTTAEKVIAVPLFIPKAAFKGIKGLMSPRKKDGDKDTTPKSPRKSPRGGKSPRRERLHSEGQSSARLGLASSAQEPVRRLSNSSLARGSPDVKPRKRSNSLSKTTGREVEKQAQQKK